VCVSLGVIRCKIILYTFNEEVQDVSLRKNEEKLIPNMQHKTKFRIETVTI